MVSIQPDKRSSTRQLIFIDLFETTLFVFKDVEQTIDRRIAHHLFCGLAEWLDNECYEPQWVTIGNQQAYMQYEEWVLLYEHVNSFIGELFFMQ